MLKIMLTKLFNLLYGKFLFYLFAVVFFFSERHKNYNTEPIRKTSKPVPKVYQCLALLAKYVTYLYTIN